MPALNKQTLINLLIDSPLREPIKINLIDIVNNTQDADLPKVYPTITKELEIFQKATDRRLKLADETIAKLNEGNSTTPSTPLAATPAPTFDPAASVEPSSLPPLPPLPPMPAMPTDPAQATQAAPLSVPPLDLPPLPTMPSPTPTLPPTDAVPAPAAPVAPATTAPATAQADADEAALAEIQKELDTLKSGAATDAGTQ